MPKNITKIRAAFFLSAVFLVSGLVILSEQSALGVGHADDYKPRAKIIFPERGSVESGIILIMAEQENKKLPADEIKSVRFEYSADRKNWTLIKEQTDPLADTKGESPDGWDARWDTEAVASGNYFLQAVMETFAGKTDRSALLPIEINKEPVAVASASLAHDGPISGLDIEPIPPREAIVMFDGSQSRDSDGAIMSWFWEFGDGATGTGQFVQHTYADTSRAYEVDLTVQDDKGAQSTGHYTINSFFDVFVMIQDPKCICKSIALRGDNKDLPGEKNAFGPDGAAGGGDDWGATGDMDDGATLGPLDGNPENETTKGEKKWTGYAFEVVADIEGDPRLCEEIQLVKNTTNGSNSKWKGKTADLDKDGTNDIDVSTKEKCEAKGGVWDAAAGKCTLEFPQSGTNYGPDTPEDTDPGGAYESPINFSYKKHPDNKIIWYDTPAFTGGANGTVKKADFVSIVRGTDGKYCYVKSSLEAAKNAGKDEEKLTETKSETGVNSVPGVP